MEDLSPIDRNPSRAKRRGLAIVFAVSAALVATHTGLVRGRPELAIVVVAVGAALTVATLVPKTGRRIYVAWMTLGLALGRITGPIVLGVVYFGVVTPLALFARLSGRDRLRLERRPRGESYWEPVERPKRRTDYFRPF